MAIVQDTPPQSAFADLQARLIDYACRVGELRSPDAVLDELNAITTQSLPLSVLGRSSVSPEVWRLGVHPDWKIRFPAQGCP